MSDYLIRLIRRSRGRMPLARPLPNSRFADYFRGETRRPAWPGDSEEPAPPGLSGDVEIRRAALAEAPVTAKGIADSHLAVEPPIHARPLHEGVSPEQPGREQPPHDQMARERVGGKPSASESSNREQGTREQTVQSAASEDSPRERAKDEPRSRIDSLRAMGAPQAFAPAASHESGLNTPDAASPVSSEVRSPSPAPANESPGLRSSPLIAREAKTLDENRPEEIPISEAPEIRESPSPVPDIASHVIQRKTDDGPLPATITNIAAVGKQPPNSPVVDSYIGEEAIRPHEYSESAPVSPSTAKGLNSKGRVLHDLARHGFEIESALQSPLSDVTEPHVAYPPFSDMSLPSEHEITNPETRSFTAFREHGPVPVQGGFSRGTVPAAPEFHELSYERGVDARTQAPGFARRRREEELPGVTIKIGRIEVRAPEPPPVAEPEPAEQPWQPPLPLSEYLRRRDGGRP